MTDNELLQKAKEAYYSGNPIMGDEEYDALERSLGLENQSNVGAHSEHYTIRHPFMMGSLSKIQIKENDKTWDEYLADVRKYCKWWKTEVTPKFDGCSFELVLDASGDFVSCSTRGDGTWGKDIYVHLKNQIDTFIKEFKKVIEAMSVKHTGYVCRGEVLVHATDYVKYKDSYVNTRAFVAGSLNNDNYQKSDEDLDLVFYDFRSTTGTHIDPNGPAFGSFSASTKDRYNIHIWNSTVKELRKSEDLAKIYYEMDNFRKLCGYALDGIVLKTPVENRSTYFDERPKDCVAIKFKPAIVETEIEDIEWNYSPKTSEYFPVGIIKPVILDSKTVTRVSLHNFGYVFENKVTPGAKVKVSMAGDIIPFLYEVVEPSEILIETPMHTYVDGIHLYKIQTTEEKQKAKFLASCDVLNIKGLGPALAETMYDFERVEHVLLFNFERFAKDYPGKTSTNLYEAFHTFLRDMSLAQFIESLAIPFCGERMSKECAVQLSGGSGDFSSMASAGYSWVFDTESPEYQRYLSIRRFVEDMYGKTFTDSVAKPSEGIKVVLTGSPKEFGYKTKAEFLSAHPEFEEVSNIKDADMLITDDLGSTSSKMKKAEKLGKEIKTYGL